jgi:hypothetical protein
MYLDAISDTRLYFAADSPRIDSRRFIKGDRGIERS